MPHEVFDQTLSRFGLEGLKGGLDLQLTKSGNIKLTRNGDFQLGTPRESGMFRFVERWRQSESAITVLFGPMTKAAAKLESLSSSRKRGEGPTLSQNPEAYHEITDSIVESQLVSSTLAGSIAIIHNNLFQRLKLDLNASDDEFRQATPAFAGFSLGEIFTAAAANFRHYDEWAAESSPSTKQLASMKALSGLLNMPAQYAVISRLNRNSSSNHSRLCEVAGEIQLKRIDVPGQQLVRSR